MFKWIGAFMITVFYSFKPNGFAERMAPIFLTIIILSSLGMLDGCGTLPNGRGWGQDATWNPGWSRIRTAAVNAALSPETWGTVAAALVLQIDDMDKRISDWASENTPLFGSQNDADKWSDYLRDISGAAYLLTALATPSGVDASKWSASKLKGLTVGATAWGFTAGTTELLKGYANRTRPDKSDDRSFPSGHVSSAGSFTTLGRRNISHLSLSPSYEKLSRIALYGVAAGTAWSRVEAKQHYPSDALAGYAMGYFISTLINDAFLGLDAKGGAFLTLGPSRDGMMANIYFAF
jgi:membrane-associated phospholipid phosphatase